MATVTTTTNGNPLRYPGGTRMDVDPPTGNLWTVSLNSSGNIELNRSTNNGGSWATQNTLVRSGVEEISMYIPYDMQEVHVVYRVNESSTDKVFHRAYRIASNSWTSEVLVASAANGGVAGAIYTGVDLLCIAVGWGNAYVPVVIGVQGGGTHGVNLVGVIAPAGGTPYVTGSILSGPTSYRSAGSGRIGPSIDLESIGDGKAAYVHNIWITYGRTRVNVMRCAWTGSGWTTPSSAYLVVDGVPAQNSIRGLYDGRRHLTATANPTNTSTVAVYERPKSNTGTTTKRTTPTHTAGVIRSCTIAYDYSQNDFRVWAVGTSNNDLYYTTYDRSAGTFSAWATVTSTDVLASPPENYSAKRNTYHNARFDVLAAHSGAPNTVVHYPAVQAYTPSAPTWVNPQTGQAQDVAATLLLDWLFNDVDVNDVQTAYAVRRQVGAGAFAYWRASDSTWQAAEVKNLSATTQLTLSAAWGAGGDANTTYAVKTWDSTDIASVYSDPVTVVPSVKVNPTIVTPTAAQVLTGDLLAVTWTVAEQTAYRVTLSSAGIQVYDSGFLSGTALAFDVPYPLVDNNPWVVGVTTKNNEGLSSNEITQAFTTNFVEPAMPDLLLTPVAADGVIRVTITNPTPVGTEPALLSQDLYRREESAPLNANPYATISTAGWTAEGGSAFARSTAQFHEGVAAFTLTGDGVTASISAIHDTFIDVDPDARYTVGSWMYSAQAQVAVSITIAWYDAADVLVWTSSEDRPIPAARWTYFGAVLSVPTNAVKAKPRIRAIGTVPAGQVIFYDEVRFEAEDPGTTTIRVAAGLPEDAVVDDWRTASGVSYEYRVTARGVNGTSFAGPWQA